MTNPQRGEVELKVGDETFVLCAEFGRLAAWMHETDIQDINVLYKRLSTADIFVLHSGVRNLCVSGNADKVSSAIRGFDGMASVVEALSAALNVGIEEDEVDPIQAKEKPAA